MKVKQTKVLKGVVRPDSSMLHLSSVDWAALAEVPEEAVNVTITFTGSDVKVEWEEPG
jgi:hypothetical protein